MRVVLFCRRTPSTVSPSVYPVHIRSRLPFIIFFFLVEIHVLSVTEMAWLNNKKLCLQNFLSCWIMILNRVKYRVKICCISGHTDILNTLLKFFILGRNQRNSTLWKPTDIVNYLEAYRNEQIIDLNETGDGTRLMYHQCHCCDALHSATVTNP